MQFLVHETWSIQSLLSDIFKSQIVLLKLVSLENVCSEACVLSGVKTKASKNDNNKKPF
jgi:hypothetical protein